MIQVFSDFACPFCYLAEPGLRKVAEAGTEVRYRAYELRPAPLPLEAPGRDPMKRRGWDEMVAPMAAELGLEVRFPELAVRTRKAHEAALFAQQEGCGRAMRDALFAAYFADGRDIGRIDVLVEIGSTLGLDRTQLKVTLDIDQLTAAVAADEAEAATLGIPGVPAYFGSDGMRPERLTGTKNYETLMMWVGTGR